MKNLLKYLFTVVVLLLISNNSFADPTVAQVDGNCFLGNDVDTHEGTTVVFLALTPLAVTDSCMTETSGYFQISLADGQYSVSYSHTNYFPLELPDDYFFVGSSYTLPDVTLDFDWEGISGNVFGIWTPENNPHRIVGDTWVLADETLEIQAGVEVQFMGNHFLIVEGLLLARGAEGDSILFTSGQADPLPGDWSVIKIDTDGPSVSEMEFCVIEYGGSQYSSLEISGQNGLHIENCFIRFSERTGVRGRNSGALLRNCTIAGNTGSGAHGMDNFGGEISENLIFGNGNSGIAISDENGLLISNNRIFQNNSGGINIYGGRSSQIVGNEIFENINSGIKVSGGSTEIVGNLIYDNSYGIICDDSGGMATVFKNTIVENNWYGINLNGSWVVHSNIIAFNGSEGINAEHGYGFVATYNLLWGNNPEFDGHYLPEYFGVINSTNANGDPCDIYANIIMDPGFTNQGSGDYSLLESSPCVDAGNPDPEFNDPDGTIADMGDSPLTKAAHPLSPNLLVVLNPCSGEGGVGQKCSGPFQYGKGRFINLASQDIPSWNQIDKWLRELAELQSAGVA